MREDDAFLEEVNALKKKIRSGQFNFCPASVSTNNWYLFSSRIIGEVSTCVRRMSFDSAAKQTERFDALQTPMRTW